MDFLLSLLATFIVGGLGWVATYFLGAPVLKFIRLREEVFDEITYIANFHPPDGQPLDAEGRAAMERVRRLGTRMHALNASLFWPASLLKMRFNLELAASNLIGISNNLPDRKGHRANFELNLFKVLRLPTRYDEPPRIPDD